MSFLDPDFSMRILPGSLRVPEMKRAEYVGFLKEGLLSAYKTIEVTPTGWTVDREETESEGVKGRRVVVEVGLRSCLSPNRNQLLFDRGFDRPDHMAFRTLTARYSGKRFVFCLADCFVHPAKLLPAQYFFLFIVSNGKIKRIHEYVDRFVWTLTSGDFV